MLQILFKILPTIRLFGIKIQLPRALQKLLRPQLTMTLDGEEDGLIDVDGLGGGLGQDLRRRDRERGRVAGRGAAGVGDDAVVGAGVVSRNRLDHD